MNKSIARISDATPYVALSASITIIIQYFWEVPEEVAGALSVITMAGINYLLIILKPLYNKFVQWIEQA